MIFGIGTIVYAASPNEDDSATTTTEGSSTKSNSKDIHVSAISVAATVLGKTEDEVKESVKDGKIGDLLIAVSKVDEFKAAYLAEMKTKLDSAVKSGTLTQTQADEKYAETEAKMKAYDGTTHLCGGSDHSKMSEKQESNKQSTQT